MWRLPRRRAARSALLAVLLALAAGAGGALWAFESAPSVSDLAARVGAYERAHGSEPVPVDRISPLLREAVVATEDERFYRERGVDLLGLLRAVPYDVSHLTLAQGASTITEQLAKVIYLGGSDHSFPGKAKEIALGFEIGSRDRRSTILADYLNTVYLGDGRYGVENASRDYFGRSAARLTLAQASLLAGLIQGPSAYDPRHAPGAARSRQVEVLQSMVRNGYISPAAATAVAARPLPIAGARPLPGLPGLRFARGASLDGLELALGAGLLALAAAALLLARLRPFPAAVWVSRATAVALVVAAMLVAARAVQVV